MDKNKKRAIEEIKAICNNKENKRIGLYLADTEVAGWKSDNENMTPFNWKCIGYIGAISSDFDITSKDFKTKRGAKHNVSKKHIKKGIKCSWNSNTNR